jgi:hypothetical protein
MSDKFVADKYCGFRMSVIDCDHLALIDVDNKGSIRIATRKSQSRCRKGVIHWFRRVVLLVSSPLESTYLKAVEGLKPPEKIESAFLQKSKLFGYHYNRVIAPLLQYMPTKSITVVRYEDLINPQSRVDALNKVVEFIFGVPPKPERVQCAFDYSSKYLHENKVDKTALKELTQQSELIEEFWDAYSAFDRIFSYRETTGDVAAAQSAGLVLSAGNIIIDDQYLGSLFSNCFVHIPS